MKKLFSENEEEKWGNHKQNGRNYHWKKAMVEVSSEKQEEQRKKLAHLGKKNNSL